EPSSEPSSTSTHCQRCSVCRCRLRRQGGNVAAAFQTGNSMEMSGGTTVSLEHAVTHDRTITISLASPLCSGYAWAPLRHGVLNLGNDTASSPHTRVPKSRAQDIRYGLNSSYRRRTFMDGIHGPF